MLPFVTEYNTSVIMNETFTLSSLIPAANGRFYTYLGSLTTPPCSETVTWFIFPEPLPVSPAQVSKFRL